MSPEPLRVRVTRRYTASAERVFDAFLDPEKAGRFLFATAAGRMVRAEVDARVGGAYLFVDRREEGDAEHFGEYLVIDRPRRLVFTFSVDRAEPRPDRVSIDITPLESGCEVALTHEMKPEWAEWADRTTEGWAGILEGLARTLGEPDAQPPA